MKRWMLPFILSSIVACNNKPSESTGLAAVESRVDGGRSALVTVRNFKKTDGQAQELAGVKMYTMAFSAIAELSDDAFYSGPGSIFDVLDMNTSIATYPIAARHPGCPNDSPCLIIGQSPARARKGDRYELEGTIRFEKSEAGWKYSSVKFTSRASGSAAPSVTQRGGSKSAAAQVSAGDVATGAPPAGRCAEDTTGLQPKKSLGRRVLDWIQNKHAIYPDSLVYVERNKHVGSVRFLQSGEVCVGTTLASYTPDIFPDARSLAVALSVPSAASGVRILALLDTDWGVQAAWIVHPDSERALSGDFLAEYRVGPARRAQIGFGWPKAANWNPAGRVVAAPGGWGDIGGAMIVASVGGQKATVVDLSKAIQFDPGCYFSRPEGLPNWSGETFQIGVHLVRLRLEPPDASRPCSTQYDSSATVLVDTRTGVATRLK